MNLTQKKDKARTLFLLCLLCAAAVGLTVWYATGGPDSAAGGEYLDVADEDVPLGAPPALVSAGDTVMLCVYADALDNVYGYQFEVRYDKTCLEYKKRLYSDIAEIPSIFATNQEDHLLVGATMTGAADGYTGRKVPVCRVEFTALAEFEPGDITLSGVNVVTDDLRYLRDVDGWTVSVSVL